MFKSFYHQFERSSEEQFRHDFGTYPPIPLQSAQVSGSFKVTHARGLGTLLYYWRRSSEYMEVLEQTPERISPVMLAVLRPYISLTQNTEKAQREGTMTCSFKKSRFMVRLEFIHRQAWEEKVRPKGMGYVAHIIRPDVHIRMLGRIASDADVFEPIISHEHIHILQSKLLELRASNTPRPDLAFPPKKLQDPKNLYLLERREIEARLHETVIHYYQRESTLPLTLTGLQELFIKVYDWTYNSTDDASNDTESRRKVPARSTYFCKQLFDLYFDLKDESTQERFISEVLSVMYGDLLGYYGSPQTSAQWHSQIPRPNLYDELYPLLAECNDQEDAMTIDRSRH